MPGESSEYQVQDPVSVARRALALSAYCCRGFIDGGKGDVDAESVRDRMIQWLSRFNLNEQLGSSEWDAIRAPLGSLTPALKNRMTWEVEGLAVLAWALGMGPLPEHDGQVDPFAVTDSVGFLTDDVDAIIVDAKLRSQDELQVYRELMYAIHCRVRDFLRNGKQKDFAGWTEVRWFELLRIDSTHLLADGDLRFKGQTISALEADQLKKYEWCICEQHRASIWLVGEEQNHWETTADT